MAIAPVSVVPVSANATLQIGTVASIVLPVVNSPSGSPIDFTSWTALQAKLVPLAPGPNTADVAFGVTSGSSGGVLTIAQSSADFAASAPGSARLIVTGTDPAAIANMLLATGTITLQVA